MSAAADVAGLVVAVALVPYLLAALLFPERFCAAAAGWLQVLLLVTALAAAHRPLGDWMARVFTSPGHRRTERVLDRAVGVDADGAQRWPVSLRSVLASSLVGVLFLYLLQRVQQWLPLDDGPPAVGSASAWHTAVSFVTDTNRQGHAGESTTGHLVQMAGLAVQDFVPRDMRTPREAGRCPPGLARPRWSRSRNSEEAGVRRCPAGTLRMPEPLAAREATTEDPMSTPGARDPGSRSPGPRAEPTVRVGRPPVPGRPGPLSTGEAAVDAQRTPLDEPTVTLPDGGPQPAHRTIRFGTPVPVEVTVGPRVRPRRRYRTWPWITAVVVVLLVLGAVLLVMLWRGATIDGDVDLVGQTRLLEWHAGTVMSW